MGGCLLPDGTGCIHSMPPLGLPFSARVRLLGSRAFLAPCAARKRLTAEASPLSPLSVFPPVSAFAGFGLPESA